MIVNYEEGILSYISSIRKHYGLPYYYNDNEKFSSLIKDNRFKQIILVLIDGMGSRLLDKYLDQNKFLNKYKQGETFTVFPPTTTAATTAILNGKSPNQTCWLGWIQYIKEVNDEIVPFYNSGYYTNIHYEANLMKKLYPDDNIIDELNKSGISATKIYPEFDPTFGCQNIDEFTEKIIKESHTKDNQFIYAYWDKYDSLMHKTGPSSKEAIALLNNINDKLEYVAENLAPDTLMCIIADHGQVDITSDIEILKTKLPKYFQRRPDIEPRALNFHIKKEYLDEFRTEFLKLYEDDCVLLSHQEVLDTHLFGSNKNHPLFEEKIGDFIAIVKNDKIFVLDKEPKFHFKGAHAGCHIDELMIPLICYYKK